MTERMFTSAVGAEERKGEREVGGEWQSGKDSWGGMEGDGGKSTMERRRG